MQVVWGDQYIEKPCSSTFQATSLIYKSIFWWTQSTPEMSF